ncbi:MAG: lipoyl synthase [Simkania negevensis]|nr:lipoyl synthase [Simkania negevensis]
MTNPLPLISEPQEGEATMGRFPKWLHYKLPKSNSLLETEKILKKEGLNTVCEEAKCPNRMECYSKKTATFLALGKECTRSCAFCEIDFSKTPKPPEKDEPLRIARAVKALGLRHVVITMVARDDLPDKGAFHIKEIIEMVRKENKEATIEVLTSDFSLDYGALQIIASAQVEIFNHNIETVRRLTPRIRHKATYERTLQVLKTMSKEHKTPLVKSGIMVGLGETEKEVQETIQDLKHAGCHIITIGQYLQPSRKKTLVKEFVTPEQFKRYEEYGLSIGVEHMYAAPFVRSSYNADLFIKKRGSPS